jgi:hypothetical protein
LCDIPRSREVIHLKQSAFHCRYNSSGIAMTKQILVVLYLIRQLSKNQEDYSDLGCDTVQCARCIIFQKNQMLPSAEQIQLCYSVGIIFLSNAGTHLPDYIVSHPRKL